MFWSILGLVVVVFLVGVFVRQRRMARIHQIRNIDGAEGPRQAPEHPELIRPHRFDQDSRGLGGGGF